MVYKYIIGVTFATILAGLATNAHASLVVPNGLNPGDAYRVIFVSSTARDATSSNISDYDAHVQTTADAAGIGGDLEWRAVASTSSASAFDHITSFVASDPDIPIYNQTGQLVASSTNVLWSGISTAIMFDEAGALAHAGVWTGTDIGGMSIANHELGADAPEIGLASVATAQWLTWTTSASTNMHALYALSGKAVIPEVPIPAAVWLFGSGLLGLVGMARMKPDQQLRKSS